MKKPSHPLTTVGTTDAAPVRQPDRPANEVASTKNSEKAHSMAADLSALFNHQFHARKIAGEYRISTNDVLTEEERESIRAHLVNNGF